MGKEYVEQREGYFIKGTRVSLDSVVYAFLRGESPEGIADYFPALQLEDDQYLADGQREFETLRQKSRQSHPALYAKLADTRRTTKTPMF